MVSMYSKLEKYNKEKKKNCMQNSLTKYLMKWNIGYNTIFKYESKKIRYKDFKLITQLRTGHNHLNSQRKWGDDKLCTMDNCVKDETLIHFLFECEYNNNKIGFIEDIQSVYGNELNFKDLDTENKLKNVLFPYNEQILDKEIMKDSEKKKIYFEKRLNILNILINFCINSGRFNELYDYKYNIKTW
eukprot:117639_1